MKNFTKLTITSPNPNAADYVGKWEKEDIENEIKDIMCRPPQNDTEWIEWVLVHDLVDIEKFTQAHQNIIIDPQVRSLTIELDDGIVLTIKKED